MSPTQHPLNVLICSSPADGHVNPAIPIAQELVERGHDVRWYTGSAYRAAVEATGAQWRPIVDAHDPSDQPWEERFPGRASLQRLAGLRFDLKHLFLDEAPGQIADLRRIHAERPVDVARTRRAAVRELRDLRAPDPEP